MVPGIFLLKISLFSTLFFLSCAPSNINSNDDEGLIAFENFVPVNKDKFSIKTRYKLSNPKSIELSHVDEFKITSSVSTEKGTVIEISKTTDKRFRNLMISFFDEKDTLRNIQILFYSKLINILDIENDEEIVFSRIQDTVPPLFFIKYSMQDGLYKICEKKELIEEFSSFDYLYLISYYYKLGTYSICELDCNRQLFKYSLQE